MPDKVCRTCKKTKETSEFYQNKTNKDGKDVDCIACKKAYMREYWKNKRAKKKSAEKVVAVIAPTEEMVERPLDKNEIISIDGVYVARCGKKTKRLEYNSREDGYNITVLFDNGIFHTVTSYGKASALIDHPYDLTHEYMEKSMVSPPKPEKVYHVGEILVEMKKQLKPVADTPVKEDKPPVVIKKEKVVTKMKALTVTYEEIRSDGNYGNRKVGITVQVGDNDTAASALKMAKKFVCLELDRTEIMVDDIRLEEAKRLVSIGEAERQEVDFSDLPF